MEIILIRHTSVSNPKKLCYGDTEMPLSSNFYEEAASIKLSLQDYIPDQVFCSCTERTQALASYLEFQNPIIEARLNEINFGAWEQKPWDEIPPQELNLWMYNYLYQKPPSGENYYEVENRILDFLKDLQKAALENLNKVVIITHAGPIRCLLSHFLSVPPCSIMGWKISEGGLWKIKWRVGYQTVVYPFLK